MSWSYDSSATEPKDQVRLLINDTDDTDEENHYFEDEEITAFLTMEGNVVKLAAAQALETLASSEVMIQKRIKLLDLSTDGPSESRELRARASELRDQVYEGDDNLPDWAELVVNPQTFEERIRNEALRTS